MPQKKASIVSANQPPPVPDTEPPPLHDEPSNPTVISVNRASPTSSSGHGSAVSIATSSRSTTSNMSPRLMRRQPLTHKMGSEHRRRYGMRSKSYDAHSHSSTPTTETSDSEVSEANTNRDSLTSQTEVDEDKTPIVSRESSRAQDYHAIVRQMYQQPVAARPSYSWESPATTEHPPPAINVTKKPIAQVAALQRAPPSYETTLEARERITSAIARQARKENQYPTRYHQPLTTVPITVTEHASVHSQLKHAPLTRSANNNRYTPPAAATQQQQRSSVEKRASSRRKTLGGEEYEELGTLAKQIDQHKRHARPSLDSQRATQHSTNSLQRRPMEINWYERLVLFERGNVLMLRSVNELRHMFDSMTASYGNYPVIRPPPLSTTTSVPTSQHQVASLKQVQQHVLRLADTRFVMFTKKNIYKKPSFRQQPHSMVHNLRATFERRAANESYV